MPSLLILKGHNGTITFCGPACYNDKNSFCTCICRGSNHSQGYDRALQNSLNNISRLKKDNSGIELSLHSKRQKATLNQSTLIF